VKIVRLPDETVEFLSWLVRQDVTLPSVITEYLKWDEYTMEQIKAHFETLHNACVESREDKSDLMKKRQT
jgi:hypothetical protein